MPEGALTVEALAALVRICLEAVGCRVPVEEDGDMVVVRNVVVTVSAGGYAGETVDGGACRRIFSMPPEAGESAATAAAMAVLGGLVARAAGAAAV
jgi:hypothetical protein